MGGATAYSRALRPESDLTKAVDSLFRLAAAGIKKRDGSYAYHTSDANWSVEELYSEFQGAFKTKLSNWRTAAAKKDTPRAQLNRTDELIAIFDGSGQRGTRPIYSRDNPDAYDQIFSHWHSQHHDELSAVVAGLRAYRRLIEPKMAAEQRVRNIDKLQNAIAALDIAQQTQDGTEKAGKVRHSSKIHVYQSEPPVGRDDVRNQCTTDLRAANNRGIVLFGAPGQGKTALARYIAMGMASDCAGIYEVDLESERQIENLPRLIARTLGHPDSPSSYELLHEVLQKDPSLVILDGFDHLLNTSDQTKLFESLRRLDDVLRSGSRVIFTCQRRFERGGFVTREVRPLDEDHALTLFHRFSDRCYCEDDYNDVARFVTGELAAHPLSIKIVSRYGGDLRLPFKDLQKLWKDKWEEIANQSPSLGDRGLLTAFELTYHSLSSSEQSLFLTLALLPDGITPDLIKAVWPDRESNIRSALLTLRHRSLLEDPLPGSQGRLRGPLFQFALNRRQDTESEEKSETVAGARRRGNSNRHLF